MTFNIWIPKFISPSYHDDDLMKENIYKKTLLQHRFSYMSIAGEQGLEPR